MSDTEFRWVRRTVRQTLLSGTVLTHAVEPVLQQRRLSVQLLSGEWTWTDWEDVPTEVELVELVEKKP